MRKKVLMFLLSFLAFVGVAKADFTLSYNQDTNFWGDVITEYPSGVSQVITDALITNAEVHCLSEDVKVKADGTVSVTFLHVNGQGSHCQHIVGVVLKNADGEIADYHHGKAGGTPDKNTYTLSGVTAGDYTLNFYVTRNGGDLVNKYGGTITITGANRPIKGSTAENKIFYHIKNVRNNKYANYEGAGVQFTQVTTPTLGSYWYLMEVADAQNVPDGYKAYRLYNAANALAVENPGSGNMTANEGVTYPAKVYCIGEHTNGGYTGVVLRPLNEDASSWNDAGGNGEKIGTYSYDDAGSIWEFEKTNITESQLIQNAVAVKTGVLNTLATEATNTERYYYGYVLSDIETKQAEIEAISVPENSLAEAMTGAIAISKMTPLAELERIAPKAGDKFIMENNGRNGCLTAFASGNYVRCVQKTSPFAYFDALWTLVATDTEGQFKLYNEKMNVYVGVLSNSNNTKFDYVSTVEEAGVYELSNVDGYATFKKVGGDNNSHLHLSNWGNNDTYPYAIVRWDNGDCSQWRLVKPFGPELTTDANNPICYALKSGRDGNYYFTLDNNKVKLFNNKSIATDETHWYFMLDESGNLKMYSKLDNKAMGYLKGTDGNTMLTNDPATTNYDSDTYTLYFAPYNQTNYNGAWFALKPSRGDTYVSNHGGTGNYMGFYNEFNDGGTRIAFEPIITYTLTDKVGNRYTGTYSGTVGETTPTFTGLEYTLTNEEWNGNNFTATIEFSGLTFPISKPREENWTFMKTEAMSDGVAYFYANLTENKVVTKSTKSENGKSYLPVADDDEIKKWQWAIYPAIENGKIVFTIKNRAADKFLGKENINFVTEGASFYWTACIGNGYGFSSVDNSKFFSANSSAAGEQNATLWGKTGSTHKGANLEFFTMAYTKATDAAGYTTLYTPIAVTVPIGVNAFSAKLNGDNTKLVLDVVERVIPANTAVLLKGAASTTYIFSATDDETGVVENNILEGATSSTEVAESMYILQSAEGAPSFAKTTEDVPGYDAYIMVQDGPESIGIDTSIFEAVANATTANANMDIYGLQRYYGLVQNADQYFCNYPSNPADGQGYPGMLDGDYETFFHSGYPEHNPSPAGVAHYLQADLGKAVKSFRFYYKKRKQNNNNRPIKITIEGSNNKDQWFAVKVIDQGLPADASVLDYYSEVISSETAYQYLRFTVNTTNTGTEFFSLSEFYILPTYAKVNETFDAVRNYRASATIKTAVALNKAYAWNTGLTKGTPIVGADHFFFADTKQSDGSYLARYLYNNNGALATSTSLNAKDAKFIWTAAQPEGTEYFTLQNKGDNTKYISYGNSGKGLWVGETAVQLDIKSSYAVHTGSVGIQRVRPSGDNDGAWMVTAADGTSFNRNSSKVNGDGWCSDYMFIPADLYEGLNTLTIVSNTSKADAVFAWDIYEAAAGSSILFSVADEITDGTLRVKSCNPAYKLEGFYSDAAYTQKITTLDELTSDKTVYAKFVLDIFSESYGDKWVNIVRKTDANHAIILGSADEGAIPTFNTFNYTNKGIVWCFVGSAESFKMYNMVSGNALALTPNANPADGVAVKMVSAADATSWHLIEKDGGAFAIAPVGNNDWGINSYTGNAGSQIKFYGVNNDGTQWYFTAIDASKPLTFSVAVTGEQPYATNTRVANLNTIVNGATSSTVVKGDVDALTYYLPVGATFTLNNSLTYRGYEFNGFLDAEGNAAEYANATIPEGGLNITASYSVDETNKYQYLFYYRDDVHNKPYRIPAIATASNNTVLAFSDYRPCSNDIGYGEVDIMLRRSYDNGKTWSEAVCIADGQGGNENVFNVGFGDAAVVADRESGKVLVMAVAGKQVFAYGTATGHNSMAKIVSNDNGESWNAPEDVTSQFMIAENSLFPKAYTMFFGSGRILQSRVYKAEGADYYRIYGALLIKHPSDTYTGECNYVVYSDDFGATWKILGGSIEAGMCCNGGNEPKVEELPDGSIVLSSRKGGGRYFNVFTYTDKATGAGVWGDVTTGVDNNGQATNGEIYKVKAIRKEDGKICDVMLQSIPAGGGRSNVTVYYKEMDYTSPVTSATFASAWPVGMLVSNMGSAYSTMILQADGNFGFFYEELPGDQWAYCMVYVPLSLEEMTDNQYSLYTVNSTITSVEIGTFYASEAMQIPEGIKAYVAKEKPSMNGTDAEGNVTGVITMTELEGIIPAHTGAVLRGEAKTYEFIPSISYGTPVEGNMMVGYEAETNDPNRMNGVNLQDVANKGDAIYFLTVKNGKAGFYAKTKDDFSVANNKAYLQIPKSMVSNARAIYFDFDDNTTAIESAFEDEATGVIYDLQGRQLKKATSNGIYIVNGKKVLK